MIVCSKYLRVGVCTLGYQLNILGWNKLKIIEQDPYSEVFRTNNHHLMNLMYSRAIVNIMCDVSFSNLEMYEPPESGRWYVVISGEKFMKASSENFVSFLSLYEYE